ncbi:MAG: hypothetical protein ACI9DK_002106 [Vicingaceae bacterium]|jgi:hypothetical protein
MNGINTILCKSKGLAIARRVNLKGAFFTNYVQRRFLVTI